MNRQHSTDEMSEISSVFTDGSDDLPANMMIGTTKPGPKQVCRQSSIDMVLKQGANSTVSRSKMLHISDILLHKFQLV